MSEFLAEAKVLVTPDTSKFRSLLVAELEAAKKGLEVTIPVITQAGQAAATAGAAAGSASKSAAGGARQLAMGFDEVAAAAGRAGAATEEDLVLWGIQEKVSRELARGQEAAALATTELAAAQATLSSARKTELVTESGFISAVKSEAEERAEILDAMNAEETGRRRNAQAAIAEAQAEKQALAIRDASVGAARRAAGAQELAALQTTKLAQAKVLDRELTAALGTAETALSDARATGTASLVTQTEAIRNDIALKQADARASLEMQVAEARTAAARQALVSAQKAELAIVEAGSLALTDRARAYATATAAKTAYEKATYALDRALQTEDTQLIRTAAALKAKTAATYDAARADALAARSAAQYTRREGFVARGAGATGLTLLGVRGATLAANASFLAGAAAVALFAKAIKSAAELESELNVFQRTAGATADEMERVGATARAIGSDLTVPAANAVDAAEAMTGFAKAGLSVADSMDAARAALLLSTAAEIDNAQATELISSALNAFNLEGSEAVRVADLLTGAANEAQGSISDMGIALQQSSAVARQAGLSVQDTVAFITLLARAGIRGSDAGTSLRTALLRLLAPTKDANKQLRQLGLTIYDSSGRIRPEIFAELGEALDELGAKERNQVLRKIFGQDAIRAAVIFGREGAAGLNDVRDAIGEVGLTADIAGARTVGLAGKFEGLKNASAGLGSSLGRLFVPITGLVIDSITPWVQWTAAVLDATAALASFAKEDVGGTFGFIKRDIESVLDVTGQVGVELNKAAQGTPFEGFFKPIRDIDATNIEELTAAVDDLIRRIPLGTSSMAELQRISGEVNREIARLGENAPDELLAVQRELERVLRRTTAELKEDLSPALKVAIVGTDGFAHSLADAASRATALNYAIEESAIRLRDYADGAERAAAATRDAANAASTYASSLDTQIALAQAAGNQQRELALLREKEARQEAHLARQRALFAEAPGPNRDKAIQNAANALAETRGEIKQIEDQIAREGQDAADRIAKARNEADKKFLDALGLRRTARENAILRAQAREGLADDIAAHTALRDFLVRSRDEAEKTLKDAKTRAEAVASLTTDIIQENNTIAELQRELVSSIGEKFEVRIEIASIVGTVRQLKRLYAAYIKELKAALAEAKKGSAIARDLRLEILETQREAFDAIKESLELDIDFASITENVRGEIAARLKLIRALRKQQSLVKKGSLEYKRLRNEIAQEQAAIEELRKQQRDRNNAFRQMSFEFLTRQQGFAAQVMGNLLGDVTLTGLTPGIKSAGLGGTTAGGSGGGAAGIGSGPLGGRGRFPEGAPRVGLPGEDLAKTAAFAKAEGSGPTRGQATVEIDILRQILRVLTNMWSAGKHPSSKKKQAAGGAAMDTM